MAGAASGKLRWIIGVLTALVFASCASAAADIESGDITDGYTPIVEEELNGFLIRGWQLPGPDNTVVGSTQYATELYRAADMSAVGDAIVTVYATPPEGERIKSVALNTPRYPQFYEAKLDLEQAGAWNVEFRLGEPINASASTAVEVTQRNRTGSILWGGTIAFLTLFALMLFAAAMVFARANKRRKQWRTKLQ